MMRGTLFVAMLVVVSTPALARDRNARPFDPNRIICKTDDVLGSRLQQKRTCLTAAEWEAMYREQRNTVERVQEFKPHLGN